MIDRAECRWGNSRAKDRKCVTYGGAEKTEVIKDKRTRTEVISREVSQSDVDVLFEDEGWKACVCV